MVQIQNTILSDEIFEEYFLCDLTLCKGMCCVDGDSGAPITREEYEEIESILPVIKEYLPPAALEVIATKGIGYVDFDGELVTSLVEEGKECVFAYRDEEGICKCSIDTAYREGRVDVQKPISCHLYPIRITKYREFTALNYHRWSVCRSAVEKGEEEGVPLYAFLEEPLIRRFGKAWYTELLVAAELKKAAESMEK